MEDFPLLAAKLAEQEQPSQGHATSAALVIRPIRSHINQYIADIHTRSFGGSAIEFWHQKEQSNIYPVLTLIAQDLVSAPSSQAFVERLFSVCGMVTVGRRNRMDKSLHMRTIQRSLKCPALSGIHARRRLRPHLLRHQSRFDPSHDIEHMRVQFPCAFLPNFVVNRVQLWTAGATCLVK